MGLICIYATSTFQTTATRARIFCTSCTVACVLSAKNIASVFAFYHSALGVRDTTCANEFTRYWAFKTNVYAKLFYQMQTI
jgi:hypothetical protein